MAVTLFFPHLCDLVQVLWEKKSYITSVFDLPSFSQNKDRNRK